MKLLIINNLESGFGEGAIYDFMRSFNRSGDEVVMRSTDGTVDLVDLLYDAEHFDAVIAAGGDGTVSGVAYTLAETGIPVLPFPAGTANLLAQNLSSPSEPHALAKMVREMRLMDFDLGEIELADGERHGFLIMAGAGYDATIMQGAAGSKKVLGPMAYFTSAFANPTPQFSKIKLNIDGREIETEGLGVLVVNFSKIQFDIPVVHENKPRDGLFDIAVMHTRDAFGLIPVFLTCMLDRSGNFPDRGNSFSVYRGREISVEADPPLAVQYDGEVTDETTPFVARLIPEAARYIVSQECLNLYGDESALPLALEF